MSNQSGAGLPEILIALLLSSLIMSGLMQHYLQMKQQYQHTQADLERALDLQLVIDLIRGRIRKAGFTPCLNIDHLTTVDHRDGHGNLRAIETSTGLQSMLRINRMSDAFVRVSTILNPYQLLVVPGEALQHDHPVLITDCYHGEVHTASAVTQTADGTLITLSKPLAFIYHPPIYMGEWVQEAFFIRNKHNADSALFYQGHHTDELTPFVHTLSLDVRHHAGATRVHVVLGLDHARTVQLETVVRSQ